MLVKVKLGALYTVLPKPYEKIRSQNNYLETVLHAMLAGCQRDGPVIGYAQNESVFLFVE